MIVWLLSAYMASAFPLLPAVPSELAAINDGSVMATERLAAAPVVPAGGGLNRSVPAFPLRSKPAVCTPLTAFASPAASVSSWFSIAGIC